ncbi:hypothetical protein D3C85_1174050 [compost metagenome]
MANGIFFEIAISLIKDMHLAIYYFSARCTKSFAFINGFWINFANFFPVIKIAAFRNPYFPAIHTITCFRALNGIIHQVFTLKFDYRGIFAEWDTCSGSIGIIHCRMLSPGNKYAKQN